MHLAVTKFTQPSVVVTVIVPLTNSAHYCTLYNIYSSQPFGGIDITTHKKVIFIFFK